jgi:hypothetical protein
MVFDSCCGVVVSSMRDPDKSGAAAARLEQILQATLTQPNFPPSTTKHVDIETGACVPIRSSFVFAMRPGNSLKRESLFFAKTG